MTVKPQIIIAGKKNDIEFWQLLSKIKSKNYTLIKVLSVKLLEQLIDLFIIPHNDVLGLNNVFLWLIASNFSKNLTYYIQKIKQISNPCVIVVFKNKTDITEKMLRSVGTDICLIIPYEEKNLSLIVDKCFNYHKQKTESADNYGF